MASIFDVPPPPVFTRDGRDGFPPEAEFELVMAEYIGELNPRKREKALMTQAMYDTILIILTNPHDTRCATAQFRFWTKKMFRLVTTSHAQIVTHENRPVAVKEQIYDVLVQCHSQCSHGGRDKTSNQVRRYYSWIPKELIARFVKSCPLCNARRTAKSGRATAGIAALTALGADAATLLAANGGLIGDSSPPSESSTSTNSAVTTPSRQTRALGGAGSNQITPFTPGSYLSSAMYAHQMPLSATSTISSILPPMPSPSHNPQDWTHWVNTTPQRMALMQSSTSALSSSEVLLNSNPTLHFSYHTGQSDGEKQYTMQPISLQTPPQTGNRDGPNIVNSDAESAQPVEHDFTAQNSQEPNPGSSSEGQAYYSQLMQQTMASFLQAPPMSHQWSTDSVTTTHSTSSASSYSSSEFEDLDELTRNSPLPPLPSSGTGVSAAKDTPASALQQQIDSLTVHLEGVNAITSHEEDEEASFQSFMSSFKQPPVEQDQIDPLLRAMNLDVMQCIPLVGDTSYMMPLQNVPSSGDTSSGTPALQAEQTDEQTNSSAPQPQVKNGRPAKLGGDSFKFPPVSKPPANKKNGKKVSRSNNRESGSKRKSSAGALTKLSATYAKESEHCESTGASVAATPDLSSYFQLQTTFNQMKEEMLGGVSPCLDPNTSFQSQTGQSQEYDTQWQSNGNDMLTQSLSASQHGEFSFNVSDMSGECSISNTGNGFMETASSAVTSSQGDSKTRHRPPQLDFSSFSNNNAFIQDNSSAFDQDISLHQNNSFLSAYPYAPADFSQSLSGSVSAPAHITQFTQPENPIVTPHIPLFNYEQMDLNFDFTGNSFVDFSGMNGGVLPMTSTSSAYGYGYDGVGMQQSLQTHGQELIRPASAGGYLEPSSHVSPQKTMSQQQQQHMAMMPAIPSAPYFHLPMSSQQQQAQARGLSEQIQAILDSAVPTDEALVEQASTCTTRSTRKK